jgi:prepilin peptidase CpaA
MLMSAQIVLAVFVGLAASIEDLQRRNISNWIPISALLAGLIWHASQQGWRGIPTALAGAAAGFAVFLVFWLLGGMGGGDVKLMAGFGALLGVTRLLEAAYMAALIGAVMAVAVLGVYEIRRRVSKKCVEKPKAIPYAPAITAGVWLSLVPR